MQLRSGRRLVSPPPPPQGGRRRCSRRPGGDHGLDEDRLSSLPEELLLDILGRLGSARKAARTSVLSRRWTGLWTELRELVFCGVMPVKVKRALAQVRPGVNRLDIYIDRDTLSDKEINSMLRAAARLAPAELEATLRTDDFTDAPIKLPCFQYTTSFELNICTIHFTLPPAGEFASLERLTMQLGHGPDDLDALVRRCPRLRSLNVDFICVVDDTVTVQSNSLEELELRFGDIDDIVDKLAVLVEAPALKEFVLVAGKAELITMSLSAPKLEEFHLEQVL